MFIGQATGKTLQANLIVAATHKIGNGKGLHYTAHPPLANVRISWKQGQTVYVYQIHKEKYYITLTPGACTLKTLQIRNVMTLW